MMTVRTHCFLLLILCFLFPSMNHAQLVKVNVPPGLDSYVGKVLQAFGVPGTAITIVKDGKVLLQKGYGVKELGKADKVDEHTLFCIASNTKAFTATAIAMLVEEGKLRWDDPVIKHLPWFRLEDPYITAEMRVRDLLTHRSGLGVGAGDLLQFPPTTYSRKEIVSRFAHVPIANSFRSTYAYSNGMYLAAAELIEAVSGQTWEEFIESRILRPLGMKETITRVSALMARPNRAWPHHYDERWITVKEEDFPVKRMGDAVNPAGGISTNATEIADWLITQLDSGRSRNGRVLFSPSSTRELWKPVTPINVPVFPAYLKPAQMNFFDYAMGFNIRDYRNHKMVGHTGGLSGAFYSRVTLIPGEKLGIAVLTNAESGNTFDAITQFVVDYYLKAPAFDWLSGYEKNYAQQKKNLARQLDSDNSAHDSASGPSLPLAEYTGTYHDPGYGDVIISLVKPDTLGIRFLNTPLLIGRLEHWQQNTFIARWNDRSLKSDAYVNFIIEADGRIGEIKMKPLPGVNFSRDFHNLRLKPFVSPEKSRFKSITSVDTAIRNFMDKYAVPGISVAITNHGKLIYTRGYGYADREQEVIVNDSSLFRIASISKTITSLTILKLIEEKKLRLDDFVFGKKGILGYKYGSLPYSENVRSIRVRHLLNHSAGGWKNTGGDPIFLNKDLPTAEQISWTLDNRPVEDTPGTKYAYSNFGFWLLGAIVEKTTGTPYDEYVRKNILAPMGITDMELGESKREERKRNEVVYYGQTPGERTYSWNTKRIGAAGGWLATATDLVQMLTRIEGSDGQPAVLSKEQIKEMTTLPDIPETNYALGWRVGDGNWWHQGSLPGTGTQLFRNANGVNCALLCNIRTSGFFKPMEELLLQITSSLAAEQTANSQLP